ncbi:Transcription factor Jun [Neofusicoccum parvum]|nr:Transcription factor Jun [Neofusicoccum parvum]
MAGTGYDFGPHPHAVRVDSIAGFSDAGLPMMRDGSDDARNNKFSFSPSQNDAMGFDPSSTAPFSEGLQQTTVHPGVLVGDGLQLHDGNESQLSDDFFAPQMLFAPLSNARRQHGQVTPPDDLSPKSTEARATFADFEEGDTLVKAEEPKESPKVNNKRRRSTKSDASTSSRKRGRKTAITLEDDDLNPEDKVKRDQFLERNRVAAHKCRQKKKEWMVQLDNDFRDLSARHKFLQAELQVLNHTLFELKNMMFQHADCKFGPIDQFIRSEAEVLQVRARAESDPSMAASAAENPPYAQSGAGFSGTAPIMQPGYGAMDPERSVERASTESSDFESLHSRSTAPDGLTTEAWVDMLQQT